MRHALLVVRCWLSWNLWTRWVSLFWTEQQHAKWAAGHLRWAIASTQDVPCNKAMCELLSRINDAIEEFDRRAAQSLTGPSGPEEPK